MSRIARIVSRLLEPRPGLEVALDVTSPELAAGLASLFTSAGVTVVPDGIAPAGIVEVEAAPSPLVPERAKLLVERVAPGGTVIVVIAGGFDNPQQAAATFGPSFDLHKVHGEAEDGAVVLRGTRRAAVDRETMKRLRGLAHAMEPTIMIGKEGLTEGLVTSAREALLRHGLVKARITPHTARRVDTDDYARELAWAAGGQLLQRVGHTALVYRPDVELAPATKRR
ncbi:MAG: YhbY family RNA-binding protein [Deltaproteobacteria bacterium]|nr:YhbY family RNA-binding protein [Deltaproteobacteria bacterium]